MLRGKIAVVTGSSRGIGRAVVEALAREGASVVVNCATSADEARAVVEAVRADGRKALAVQADMSRPLEIRRLFQETMEHFGRLDILIANAGYSVFKPLQDTTEEDFDTTYDLNVKGTFFCLQESLSHMADGGRIVCMSTIGTELNLPGGACYFGSKAAIEQFCRVLAKEVAPRGINVNIVSPGLIDTQMLRDVFATMEPDAPRQIIGLTPLARLGSPEEVAEVVAFLVSNRARWVTRQNIAVDGGIISR